MLCRRSKRLWCLRNMLFWLRTRHYISLTKPRATRSAVNWRLDRLHLDSILTYAIREETNTLAICSYLSIMKYVVSYEDDTKAMGMRENIVVFYDARLSSQPRLT